MVSTMQLIFRRFSGDAIDPPAAGQVYIHHRCLLEQRGRRDLALLILEHGTKFFPQGPGEPETLVLDADPTLDDLLAATFAMRLFAGQPLPDGSRAFARYAALVREGLRPGDMPIEVSLEGIFRWIRRVHGRDLAEPEAAQGFLRDWTRMAAVILRAAEAGMDPFTAHLFAPGDEFAREQLYLAGDHDKYRDDVLRGERWLVRLPGLPHEASGLVLRQPESRLAKDWARCDEETPTGQAYQFLAVDQGEGKWIFSTNPVQRLSLKSLAERLQAAEAAQDPERARRDPWFDGKPFGHTLIAHPHAGTVLTDDQVLDVVKRWAGARPYRPRKRNLKKILTAAALAALLLLLPLGAVIAIRHVLSGSSESQTPTTVDLASIPPPPAEHKIRAVLFNNETCERGLTPVAGRRGALMCVEQHVSLRPGTNDITFMEENGFREPRPVRLTVGVRAEAAGESYSAEHLVSVRLNDKELLDGSQERQAEGLPVQLDAAKNVLRFVVNNPRPAPLPAVLEVRWQDDPRGMKLHIVSVGVEAYSEEESGFRPLKFAAADARDIANDLAAHWKEKFQVEVANPNILVNKTKDDVLAALEDLTKPGVVNEHDLVVVVLSGHGERNPKSGEYYFVPASFKKGNLIRTGLPWSVMKDAFVSMGCRVVVILDTCHSGAAGLKGGGSGELQAAVDKALADLAGTKRDIVILAACLGSEASREDETWKHGALSLAVLECLSGEQTVAVQPNSESYKKLRDRRGAGIITLSDLGDYARIRVSELVQNDQSVVLRALNDIAPQHIPIGAYDPPE